MTEVRAAMTGDFSVPPARTVQAVTVLEDGRVLGVAGFYRDLDRLVMFTEVMDSKGWQRKRAVVKACRAVLTAADSTRLPAQAEADPAVGASTRFLEHLGFRRLAGNIFQREVGCG